MRIGGPRFTSGLTAVPKQKVENTQELQIDADGQATWTPRQEGEPQQHGEEHVPSQENSPRSRDSDSYEGVLAEMMPYEISSDSEPDAPT